MTDLLTDADDELLDIIAQSEVTSFIEIANLLGLDPKSSFRNADLNNVDFGAADLSGYDFSEANLTNVFLGDAKIYRAKWPINFDAKAVKKRQRSKGRDGGKSPDKQTKNLDEPVDRPDERMPAIKHEHGDAAIFGDLLKLANEGDPLYMYEVATRYERGHRVKKDHQLALEYYERAARLGYARALWRLECLTNPSLNGNQQLRGVNSIRSKEKQRAKPSHRRRPGQRHHKDRKE